MLAKGDVQADFAKICVLRAQPCLRHSSAEHVASLPRDLVRSRFLLSHQTVRRGCHSQGKGRKVTCTRHRSCRRSAHKTRSPFYGPPSPGSPCWPPRVPQVAWVHADSLPIATQQMRCPFMCRGPSHVTPGDAQLVDVHRAFIVASASFPAHERLRSSLAITRSPPTRSNVVSCRKSLGIYHISRQTLMLWGRCAHENASCRRLRTRNHARIIHQWTIASRLDSGFQHSAMPAGSTVFPSWQPVRLVQRPKRCTR